MMSRILPLSDGALVGLIEVGPRDGTGEALVPGMKLESK